MIGREYSPQRVVESYIKTSILPIVYLLIPSGHIADTRNPKPNMAQAERCPIYIHIKTKTFIYMCVLFCLSLGNFTYLLSLIVSYFWYIVWSDMVLSSVLYALQGDTLTGRPTLFGGHSCQNLPETHKEN